MSRCEWCREPEAKVFVLAPVGAHKFVICEPCAEVFAESIDRDERLIAIASVKAVA